MTEKEKECINDQINENNKEDIDNKENRIKFMKRTMDAEEKQDKREAINIKKEDEKHNKKRRIVFT